MSIDDSIIAEGPVSADNLDLSPDNVVWFPFTREGPPRNRIVDVSARDQRSGASVVNISEFRRKPVKHHRSDALVPPPTLGDESAQQLEEVVARSIFEFDAEPWGRGP